MQSSAKFFNLWVWLALSLTLGLAPFLPQPHVWEKLMWILSGAENMRAIDWFDFFMHGIPWLMLVIAFVLRLRRSR